MGFGAATNPGLRRSLHSRLRPGLNFRLTTSHMNFKTTVILLILLAAVGGLPVLHTRLRRTKAQEARRTQAARRGFNVGRQQGVGLPRRRKPTTLEKKGKDWRLTEPMSTAADSNEVIRCSAAWSISSRRPSSIPRKPHR